MMLDGLHFKEEILIQYSKSKRWTFVDALNCRLKIVKNIKFGRHITPLTKCSFSFGILIFAVLLQNLKPNRVELFVILLCKFTRLNYIPNFKEVLVHLNLLK